MAEPVYLSGGRIQGRSDDTLALTPTVDENFEGDGAGSPTTWGNTDNTATVFNTTTNVLDWDAVRDGSNNSASFDLQQSSALDGSNAHATAWVLRFKFVIDNRTAGGNSSNKILIGLSSHDHTTTYGSSQDSISLRASSDSGGGTDTFTACDSNSNAMDTEKVEFARDTSEGIYHVEIIRKTDTTATINIFDSTGYGTLLESEDFTPETGLDPLRYIVVKNRDSVAQNSPNGIFNGTIDDIKFYNGITDASDAAKDKSSITNVPIGTRYEETDTRKIFRRTGTAPQHLGWTEKGTSGTSSLIAWFDATDISTITKDGSNLVSVWADKMGTSAYNLAQATSGDKPTWVDDDRNGRDVINFGAPAGAYMQTDFGLTLAQPYTIVTAWVFAANDSTERVGYDSNDSSNRAIFIKNSTASSWRIHAGADLSFTDATIPTNWGYSVGVFNGASSEIRINGSSAATGNAGSDSFTPMTVGTDRNAGTPWEQKIMHVLIYNKALSSGEIAELETWLDSEVNP